MTHRTGIALLLLMALVAVGAPARAESPKDRATKLMKKLAKDKDPDVRAEAARELGNMGAWDAVPALATALSDPSDQVRANAAYALAGLKDKARDAVPALRDALHDPDRTTRYNVIVALINLKAATPAELAAPVASLLADADADDREQVVEMLVNLGLADPTVRRTVFDTLERGSAEVRDRVLHQMWSDHTLEENAPWRAEVVAHITRMITTDRAPNVRTGAINLLYHVKPVPASVGEALMKAIDDPDPEVAAAAASSINSIERSPLPMKAITRLTQRLKTGTPRDRAAAAHTLGHMMGWREHFTPALVNTMLTDQESTVRVAAVAALGEVDDDTAIPSLLKALKTDDDPGVKVAVCEIWARTMAKLRLARTKRLEAALTALDAARASDPSPRVKAAAQAAADALRK